MYKTMHKNEVCLLGSNFILFFKWGYWIWLIPGGTSRASVAEAAMPWLLKVEGGWWDALANAVLALDGVAGHLSVCPGLRFLHAGWLCELCQRFSLEIRARRLWTCWCSGAESCGLCISRAREKANADNYRCCKNKTKENPIRSKNRSKIVSLAKFEIMPALKFSCIVNISCQN